jgi:hypothetical protein
VSILDGLVDQLGEMDRWSRQMVRELTYLPDTLAQFRESVGNFQRVTKRLADATDTLELVNQIPIGALRAVRDQLAGAPGASVVSGALGDLSEALATAVRLNPLWPRDSASGPSGPTGSHEPTWSPEPTGSSEPTGLPTPEDDE